MQIKDEINPESVFYPLESIHPDIQICCVSIPAFAREYLDKIPWQYYNSLKNITIDETVLKQSFLSPEEIEVLNGFKTIKKQIEWMCGRFAIKTLVSSCQSSCIHYQDIAIAYEEQGAPFLKNFPALSISISHSHDYAVGGISLNKDIEIGLDIEKIQRKDLNCFMSVAFTQKERLYLPGDSYSKIYRNWTIKEAYLKYIKKGFNESLKKIEILDEKIFYDNTPLTDVKIVSKTIDKVYAFTLVYGKRSGSQLRS
jgi:4'-phosphopantetheinyl transferase